MYKYIWLCLVVYWLVACSQPPTPNKDVVALLSYQANLQSQQALSLNETTYNKLIYLSFAPSTGKLDVEIEFNYWDTDTVSLFQGEAGRPGVLVRDLIFDGHRWRLANNFLLDQAQIEQLQQGRLYIESRNRYQNQLRIRGQILLPEIELYAATLAPMLLNSGINYRAKAFFTYDPKTEQLFSHTQFFNLHDISIDSLQLHDGSAKRALVGAYSVDTNDALHYHLMQAVFTNEQLQSLRDGQMEIQAHTSSNSIQGFFQALIPSEP
ncbi:MAG: hypothetical protein OEZ58_03615 [Gammaproteobacteria bacterium]|nr:hypothetical protein [Gammaproteobacteria bacterium]